MRHRLSILRTLIAVVLGVVTTIAVAWVFAARSIADDGKTSTQRLFPTRGRIVHPLMGGPPNCLRTSVHQSTGAIFLRATAYGPVGLQVLGTPMPSFLQSVSTPPDDLVPWWAKSSALPFLASGEWPRGRDVSWCEYQASGWPFPALGTTYRIAPNYTRQREFGLEILSKHSRFIGVTWPRGTEIILPLKPIPHGFALNTLLYSALWFGLITGAAGAMRMVRNARRARRHLCPHCAYDLSATPLDRPCPECGRVRTQGSQMSK